MVGQKIDRVHPPIEPCWYEALAQSYTTLFLPGANTSNCAGLGCKHITKEPNVGNVLSVQKENICVQNLHRQSVGKEARTELTT